MPKQNQTNKHKHNKQRKKKEVKYVKAINMLEIHLRGIKHLFTKFTQSYPMQSLLPKE